MDRKIRILIEAAVASVVFVATASADIVVDQQPTYLGGYGSDTEFFDIAGNPVWQRNADNIRLNQSAVVRHVSWQGFYGGDEQSHLPPTGSEFLRVRFYGARTSDGLPDDFNIIFEQTYVDLARTPTGHTIAVQGRPLEYSYEANLSPDLSLDVATTYWLEIAQIGDPDSHFRWETGFGAVPRSAYTGNLTAGEWLSGSGSLAFQLSTVPEPSTGLFVLFTLGVVMARAPRRMPGVSQKR